MEEVAYTWFNRLIAVRFMEVNDYLPSRIRVLSSESAGKLEPDFVTTPFDTDLEFTPYEKDLVYQLKDENKLDELFRMLFIKQCNKLSEILPGLFETISDYTELLLNISFTDKDGIVYHLTHDISEDEFNVEKEGQVEIIGWMYQYYNTEPKDEVFALLKKNIKITKERIPAATQLFTPDWIVRYMVENSLGRLWVEGHPNETLKQSWKYYLEEAEQEPDVQEQLKKIREEYAKLNPTDIKIIDPCMGSGHILVYAFEVLMQIYTSQGYIEREAAKLILQNNLYGIDIDKRAYQLAYFAVMMKARQYNRRIFNEHITPNLIAIKNLENISKSVLKRLGGLEPLGLRLTEDFEDAEEYGSILQVDYTEHDLSLLEMKLEEIEKEAEHGNLLDQTDAEDCVKLLRPLTKQARLLAQKYDVVVTNPPYMGASGMGAKLLRYVKAIYPNSKNDLFAVFIERIYCMVSKIGFQAMITQHAWMFLSGYEKLRESIRKMNTINMIHLGAHAFEEIGGEVVQTASFVFCKKRIDHYNGIYVRLVSLGNQITKERAFVSGANRFRTTENQFDYVPGKRIVYWIGTPNLWKHETIGKKFVSGGRNKTHNNEKYVREWWEVTKSSNWILYMNGGNYRKWYGNLQEVVNWSETARKEYASHGGLVDQNNVDSFGISWNGVCGDLYGFRIKPIGIPFSSSSPTIVNRSDKPPYLVLAFLNSKACHCILSALNPTLQLNVGEVLDTPLELPQNCSQVENITKDSIDLERHDWDAFETSCDFKHHPLLSEITDSKPIGFHKSEIQPEWTADAKQMEFAVFCVENLANDLDIDPTDAYDLLSVKSDILSTYIIPCYDALHTQDKDYIINDIKQVMRDKGVLA